MTEAQKLAWNAVQTYVCDEGEPTPDPSDLVNFTYDQFRLMLTDACGKPVDKEDAETLLTQILQSMKVEDLSPNEPTFCLNVETLVDILCECMERMSYFVKKVVDLDQLDLRDKTADQIFSAVFGDKDCDTNIKINGHALKKLIARILAADPVYTEIAAEQRRGLEKYGGIKHDDEHDKRDWRVFIHDHLDEAHNDHKFRSQLIKIAGLCKSAVESFDRKQKS